MKEMTIEEKAAKYERILQSQKRAAKRRAVYYTLLAQKAAESGIKVTNAEIEEYLRKHKL